MSEKKWLALVIRTAVVFKWLVYHTHDSRRSQAGFPDLVCVRKGRVLFRELKTDRGKLTLQQETWLACLRSAGADAQVWRPRDWAEIERTLRGET